MQYIEPRAKYSLCHRAALQLKRVFEEKKQNNKNNPTKLTRTDHRVTDQATSFN